MDVHRAARIMAVAHGGQAVLSQATSEMLDDHVVLRDLGEHRLKDIAEPVRLYQLGNALFPPLRSLYRASLPTPLSSFLGREVEVAEVVSLCTAGGARLVTLLGPGGIGKTRLALRAAADAAGEYPDGVYWVELASLRDPALILPVVAQALYLREQPDRDIGTLLVERLRGARILLVLDNAEHLLPEGAAAFQVIGDVEGPRLLVTSRARLRLPGEHVYTVPPLESTDAVELFTARARALTRGFSASSAVEGLCDRLDRLPLAIELAAARIAVLSPEQLLDRIGGRLDLLKSGSNVESRQRTLLATIDWSYELLEPGEQRVFRALSVFAGGCSLDAAEEICSTDLDAVESLLDKSLLQRLDDGPRARFGMLETIRQRAEDLLEAAGEADRIQAAHADWFIDLAVQADAAQRSLLLDSWLRRLAPEEHNLRAVMAWAIGRNDSARITRLAASLALTWVWWGEIAEIRRWVDGACERLGGSDDVLRARVLMVTGLRLRDAGRSCGSRRAPRGSARAVQTVRRC